MKRMLTLTKNKGTDLFNRAREGTSSRDREVSPVVVDENADTPEANVSRAIRAFCDAGGPNRNEETDEVTFLPVIVDSAESSPAAATAALYTIRKTLDVKNMSKPYAQYNALMLLRILVDNPGATFTRNVDAKFVQTVKELFRNCRDPSVRQLMTETLEYFENAKSDDPGLQPLREWYTKEKSHIKRLPPPPPGPPQRSASFPNQQSSSRPALPPVQELAARISEAQMSAKLLMQILQSTPPDEILSNQLIREFADRCTAASRSVQTYIEASNPPPDESTLVTLFETNEQLASALSRHQLAVFNARQKLGNAPQSNGNSPTATTAPAAATAPGQEPSLFRNSQPPPTTDAAYQEQRQSYIDQQQQQRQSYSDNRHSYSDKRHSKTQPTSTSTPPPAQSGGDNPFADPRLEDAPVPPPAPSGTMVMQGARRPSPIDSNARPDDRHPMADPSPVTPEVPHGYQPYRY